MITEFDPAVNELFFAKRVVLVEGDTEIAVFQRAAELLGIFQIAPHTKRDVTFINCHGKWTIPLFQEVLNHFRVNYTVFHDEDSSKAQPRGANARIGSLVIPPNERRMFSPENIESELNYVARDKEKPFAAIRRLEQLAASRAIPIRFQQHVFAAWGVEFEVVTSLEVAAGLDTPIVPDEES